MAMSTVLHGLRQQREELQLTQRQLAARAGVAYNTIFYAERGNPVSYKSEAKIKAALKSARIEREREQEAQVNRQDHSEQSDPGTGE